MTTVGVGVMSGSDSDSEMSEEDKTVADDMFADIFIDTSNVTELVMLLLLLLVMLLSLTQLF